MGDKEVDCAVPIKVDRDDDGGRFSEERSAVGEGSCTVVPTNVARIETIRDGDVFEAVAVEIGECDVARVPLRVAEVSRRVEDAVALVVEKCFSLGAVVADDDVEAVVAVNVCEGNRVGTIGGVTEIRCGEISLTIVQEDAVEQG